jgi:hypothetical protein
MARDGKTQVDVFISYAHSDRRFVQRLAGCLRQVGVRYFLDNERLVWGDRLTDKVSDALNECIAVLVVISPGSLKSQWVPFELGHALGAGSMGVTKIILPLVTHPDLDVPAYIKEFHWISDIMGAKKFFQSCEWTNHVAQSRSGMSQDLRDLRQKLAQANRQITALGSMIKLLEGYLPGLEDRDDVDG